ncbi:MAG: hypothetical protein V1647_02345 [Pseudomonadota bacterium]
MANKMLSHLLNRLMNTPEKKSVKTARKHKPIKKKPVKKVKPAKKAKPTTKKPIKKVKAAKRVKAVKKIKSAKKIKLVKKIKPAKKVKHVKQVKKVIKPVKPAKLVKPAKPVKPVKSVEKKSIPIVQKIKKCKKSLCKDPAAINGYCRYHYISSWKIENIDKRVKKVNHLEKSINEIKKRFPHDYLELIRADLVSDEVFRKVLKDMDLEDDISDFEISDDTQRILESYSSLVDIDREE